MLSKLVPSVVGNHPLGVYKPETSSCLILGKAFRYEKCNKLLCYTDTCRSSSKENGSLILSRHPGSLDGIDETSEDNCTCTLNVIIETSVLSCVAFQGWKGIFEILELDDDPKSGQS